jgi:hypothetical protein
MSEAPKGIPAPMSVPSLLRQAAAEEEAPSCQHLIEGSWLGGASGNL